MEIAMLLAVGMILLSSIALFRQEFASTAVRRFSQWRYFHPFEVLSRAVTGLLLVFTASGTANPQLFTWLGYLLMMVGAGLVLTPPALHRNFAARTANWLAHLGHWMGILGLVLGCALVALVFVPLQ